MARIGFKIKNMKKWEKAIKSQSFQTLLRKNVRRATLANALIATAEQRRVISSASGLAKNAALTIALKGVDKPLVGEGDLFQSITQKSIDDFTAFSGVLRTDGAFNVAVTAHDGATIKVTSAMRGMFFILFKASEALEKGGTPPVLTGRAAELFNLSRSWAPLGKSTTAIRIPPRPWVEKAFKSPNLRRTSQKNWEEAIQKTFRTQAK